MGARTIGCTAKGDRKTGTHPELSGDVPAPHLDDQAHDQWVSSELIQNWKDAPKPLSGVNTSSDYLVHLRKLILRMIESPGNVAAGRVTDLFSGVAAQLELAYGSLQDAARHGDRRALALLHDPCLVASACFAIKCKVDGQEPFVRGAYSIYRSPYLVERLFCC
jgi:hypothetical protein